MSLLRKVLLLPKGGAGGAVYEPLKADYTFLYGAGAPFSFYYDYLYGDQVLIDVSDYISIAYQNTQRKMVRIKETGVLWVVYVALEGTVSQVYVKWSQDEGETWGGKTLISTYDGMESYTQWYPSIAVDSAGYLHVVWCGKATGYTTNDQIWYSKYNGLLWSTPVLLSTKSSHALYTQSTPMIAVDTLDNLHVVWSGRPAYVDELTSAQIWYTKFDVEIEGYIFGNETVGIFEVPIEDWIGGSVFTPTKSGQAESITACLKRTGEEVSSHIKCAIYRHSDLSLVGSTEERTIIVSDTPTLYQFNFIVKPNLIAGTEYILVAWADDTSAEVCLMADFGETEQEHYYYEVYNDFPASLNPLGIVHLDFACSIYCTYSPWSEPLRISTYDGMENYYQYSPSVAVDGSDKLHVVWYGRATGFTTYNQIWCAYFDGAWSTPVRISTGDGMDGFHQTFPCIAIGYDDKLHVVWDGRATGFANTQIWYTKYDGSWSTPLRISTGSGMENYVQQLASIAVRTNGSIAVLWNGKATGLADYYKVFYANYITSWSDPECLQPDGSNTHPNLRWSRHHQD